MQHQNQTPEPRTYNPNNPEDLAKILPGVYWCKGWRYRESIEVVTVYRHRRTGNRMVSDGCEYTIDTLRPEPNYPKSYRLYGPIECPAGVFD